MDKYMVRRIKDNNELISYVMLLLSHYKPLTNSILWWYKILINLFKMYLFLITTLRGSISIKDVKISFQTVAMSYTLPKSTLDMIFMDYCDRGQAKITKKKCGSPAIPGLEQNTLDPFTLLLCKVVGHIMCFIMVMCLYYSLYFQTHLGLIILKFFFSCGMLVCTPPYTTITHLWIPLFSKLTLIYYSQNKD